MELKRVFTLHSRYIDDWLFCRRCFIAFGFSSLLLAVCCLAHNACGGKLLLISGVMNSLSDLGGLNHHLILFLKTGEEDRSHIMVACISQLEIKSLTCPEINCLHKNKVCTV